MTSWGVGPKFASISLVVLLVTGFANFYYVPALALPFSLLRFLAGVALIVLGVAMFLVAAVQVHKAFDEGKLVTSGIYAYVRNPVYAAFIWLIAPGLILVTGLLLLIILPFVMYGLIRFLLLDEDNYLEEKFGEEYLEYKRRVNSIIPKFAW
jgi:protein-S-isoprenylcysteine O-methyltransferase Ste14